jgi:hypothetical protein
MGIQDTYTSVYTTYGMTYTYTDYYTCLTLVVAALRQWHLPHHDLKARLGVSERSEGRCVRRFFRAKNPCFDANDGYAYG